MGHKQFVKLKIYVNLYSSSRIGMVSVKYNVYNLLLLPAINGLIHTRPMPRSIPFEIIRKFNISGISGGKKWNSSIIRGGFRAAATAMIGVFMSKANGFQLLTVFTKASILDFVVVLDVPLIIWTKNFCC